LVIKYFYYQNPINRTESPIPSRASGFIQNLLCFNIEDIRCEFSLTWSFKSSRHRSELSRNNWRLLYS